MVIHVVTTCGLVTKASGKFSAFVFTVDPGGDRSLHSSGYYLLKHNEPYPRRLLLFLLYLNIDV
jgi:hypothetical protein